MSINKQTSNWVKHVIGDEQLSSNLLKCSAGDQAARVVADRVKWLKTKTAKS